MPKKSNRSMEQERKEQHNRRNEESQPGYGNKKLEGPDRPST